MVRVIYYANSNYSKLCSPLVERSTEAFGYRIAFSTAERHEANLTPTRDCSRVFCLTGDYLNQAVIAQLPKASLLHFMTLVGAEEMAMKTLKALNSRRVGHSLG